MNMDSFEREVYEMVNDKDRQRSIRRKYEKQKKDESMKIFNRAAAFGALSFASGLLGAIEIIPLLMATPACVGFALACAFTFGVWAENNRNNR